MLLENDWIDTHEELPSVDIAWMPVWVLVEDQCDYIDCAGNEHKKGQLSVEPDDWYGEKGGSFYRYGEHVIAWKVIDVPEVPSILVFSDEEQEMVDTDNIENAIIQLHNHWLEEKTKYEAI